MRPKTSVHEGLSGLWPNPRGVTVARGLDSIALGDSEASVMQGTQSREMMSDRQPAKEGPEGRGPPCPSLRAPPGATMLLTRPGGGAGVVLRWELPSAGASGPRKWEGVPRYWKKWPRASCSSSEVMTEGP